MYRDSTFSHCILAALSLSTLSDLSFITGKATSYIQKVPIKDY